MPNDLDLDDRIRALVSSAVADAPTAPDVEQIRTQPVARKHPSWPKWTAVLAALLAAGGATVALQPAHEGTVDTDKRPDTSTTFVALPPDQPVIVTAGPDGIIERIGDEKNTITAEPMAMVLALDDGSFVAQRQSRDPSIVLVDRSGHIEPLLNAVSGSLTLHDFAVVDGRRLLLYSNYKNDDPNNPDEELYALDLDAGQREIALGNIGGWEYGTSRLTMATTGLIIGTSEPIAGTQFFAKAIPGSPAASQPLPNPADFGLEAHYGDCDCPRGFAIDADGTTLYWLAPTGTPGNHYEGTTIVAAPLDDPHNATEPAPVTRLTPTSDVAFIDPGKRGVLVSFRQPAPTREGPMLSSDSGSQFLEGAVATAGPNG